MAASEMMVARSAAVIENGGGDVNLQLPQMIV
jgi:hypothetical protein